MYVAQPNVAKRHQQSMHARNVLEKTNRIVDIHAQDVCNARALETNLQCLTIEASAAAARASHKQVAQKIHFDTFDAMSLAEFTASSGRVEAESAGCEAQRFGLPGGCKDLADFVQHSGVGRRATSCIAANRCLVNQNQLVNLVRPNQFLVRPGLGGNQFQFMCQCWVQRIVYQRAFSTSRDSRDTDQTTERK